MTKTVSPLDKLLPEIAEAIADWHEQNTPEKVKEDIHTLLDEHKNTVLLKLLGFDSRYGRDWEIDRSGNRMDTSFAGNYLHSHQQQAIEDFLKSVYMPQLTKVEKEKLAKEMRKEYLYTINWKLRASVHAIATRDLENLLKELLSPTQVETFAQLTNLLNPEDTQS